MTYVISYFLIGLVIACITELLLVNHYENSIYFTYRPTVAGILINTVLWPVQVIYLARHFI